MTKKPKLVAHRHEFTHMRDKYLQQGHCAFFLLGVSKRVSARVGRVAGVGWFVQSAARGTGTAYS